MLAALRGEPADKIVWQPRLHHWYEVNRKRGTLPPRYQGWDILDIYDDLMATPRSYHYFGDAVKSIESDDVEVWTRRTTDTLAVRYVTPVGELHEWSRITEWGTSSMHREYPVKDVKDFKVLTYILQNQRFEFDPSLYEYARKRIGDRAPSIAGIPHVPVMRLFIWYMGYERGIIALWKHPKEVQELLQVMEENDDKRLVALKASPIEVINFGDNIHHDLSTPPIFRKYILPYYQRRTQELHDAGKLCTSHWDGRVKKLLPFMKETGLDAIECLTTQPQGDVTFEELREAMKTVTLMDGMPATYFLPATSATEVAACARKALELFSPRLVLGVGDMVPPDGDVEKVRLVSKIVDDFKP